jgi:N-acetylglucosamine-6-phosphate deacetylase
MLCIQNAIIFTPHKRIIRGGVLVEDACIMAVGAMDEVVCPPDSWVIDATGLILVPGFIDLQINGAFGDDFTANPASIWSVASKLPRFGVTSFLPTIITSPPQTIVAAQKVLSEGAPAEYLGAMPLGLHLEGPFINPERIGAHNPTHLQSPDLAIIGDWSPARGVRLVTLAPELLGAKKLITTLAERKVVVSAGHTMATYPEAQESFRAGIRYGTHLFNAMPPWNHREPGLVGALLTEPQIVVGLIVDGIHVHPAMVNSVWQLLGNNRLNLVTDAMAALGMLPGTYQLGDFQVTVDEKSARLASGILAGSILSLDAALRNLMAFTSCSLEEALPTITTTPATLLDLENQKGNIAPGYDADLVLLTPDLSVECTIIAGQVVYQAKTPKGWQGLMD